MAHIFSHTPFTAGGEAKEARAIARQFRCHKHGKKVRLEFDYDTNECVCDIYIRSCCKELAQTVANALRDEGFEVPFHWSLIDN
ncbi:MAG: hypothetical protein IKQ20_06200 [Bacteroidales bacterium]|nr:hypothetical protein [Bacteroidales bacterium]